MIEETTVESYTPAAVILPYEVTGEYYVEELGELDAKPVYSFFKRFFDIVLSLFALIVLLIPMLIIAVIVKLTSPGSVLYKQERLGKDGVSFEIIKFRSMYADAESNGAQWSDGENDERITPFGKFLRRTRMDELPQFAQILTGKMSLVGPRRGARMLRRKVRDLHTRLQRASEGQAGTHRAGAGLRRLRSAAGGEGSVRYRVHKEALALARPEMHTAHSAHNLFS